MKFSEIELKPDIRKALKKMKFEELTPIQEATFPHIMAGKDIIALAETGSGKTAACGIPILQSIDPDLDAVQALVIVPTRELALQYVSAISDIARFTNISPFAVYGGFSIETQKAKLDHGVDVLIATPGRLIDLLYNSPLSLAEVRTLILDEADEMLTMGFLTDIEFIISCLIHEHQTLLFSATMPKEIKTLAKRYLKNPEMLELNIDQVTPQSLSHQFQEVAGRAKLSWLIQYIDSAKPIQGILFCNSRRNCERLYGHLKEEVKSIEMIHGGMEQSRRSSIFNRFRKKQIRFIVATSIAARGLDFSHVTHIINYDFPESLEAYTHRSGRTARMGREGTAVTLYSRRDLRTLKRIIQRNHIDPVWLGEKPDLTKLSKPKKHPRKRYGRQSKKGTLRTKRKPRRKD